MPPGWNRRIDGLSPRTFALCSLAITRSCLKSIQLNAQRWKVKNELDSQWFHWSREKNLVRPWRHWSGRMFHRLAHRAARLLCRLSLRPFFLCWSFAWIVGTTYDPSFDGRRLGVCGTALSRIRRWQLAAAGPSLCPDFFRIGATVPVAKSNCRCGGSNPAGNANLFEPSGVCSSHSNCFCHLDPHGQAVVEMVRRTRCDCFAGADAQDANVERTGSCDLSGHNDVRGSRLADVDGNRLVLDHVSGSYLHRPNPERACARDLAACLGCPLIAPCLTRE